MPKVYITSGTTWAGVTTNNTNVLVACIGAGGYGDDSRGVSGAGGGGGEYAALSVHYHSNQTIDGVFRTMQIGDRNINDGNTKWNNNSAGGCYITAAPGEAGGGGGGGGGAGGTGGTPTCPGATCYAGGNGGSFTLSGGGGGGGSAGPDGKGGNGGTGANNYYAGTGGGGNGGENGTGGYQAVGGAGNNGGGDGGGYSNSHIGQPGNNFEIGYGSGGGGSGGFAYEGASSNGYDGGLYGAGGGGGGYCGSICPGGAGSQGIIVISYQLTPQCDLQSVANLSKPQKNLQSKASILLNVKSDLQSIANLTKPQQDLQSKGSLILNRRRELQSMANIFKPVKDIQSSAFLSSAYYTLVSFNGYYLNTVLNITETVLHDGAPNRNLSIYNIARRDGEKVVSAYFARKEIEVTGFIQSTAQSSLEVLIDALKQNLQVYGKLLISYANGFREYYAMFSELTINREPDNIDWCQFSVKFIVPSGTSQDINSTTITASNVAFPYVYTLNNIGSAEAFPQLTLTIHSSSNLQDIILSGAKSLTIPAPDPFLTTATGTSESYLYLNNTSLFATSYPYDITIDNEDMTVTHNNIAGHTLTVTRAVNGTTATSHDLYSAVTCIGLIPTFYNGDILIIDWETYTIYYNSTRYIDYTGAFHSFLSGNNQFLIRSNYGTATINLQTYYYSNYL